MKNFYKGGRGLCFCQSVQEAEPRSYKPDHHTKQNTIINSLWPTAYSLLLIFVSMFSLSDAWAQSGRTLSGVVRSAAEGQSPRKQTVVVGEKLTEHTLNYPLPIYRIGEQDTIVSSLANHNGKLIILDFWASWCTSCFRAFPKNMSLAQRFQDRVEFLFIHSKQDNVTKAIKKLQENDLSPRQFVLSDNILNDIFTYRFLPHYVWLSPTGIVLAMTDDTMLSEENIEKVLQSIENQ